MRTTILAAQIPIKQFPVSAPVGHWGIGARRRAVVERERPDEDVRGLLLQALQQANVTCKLVRVKHADHGYRPNPKSSVISPTRAEIEEMEFAWFAKHLAGVTSSPQSNQDP